MPRPPRATRTRRTPRPPREADIDDHTRHQGQRPLGLAVTVSRGAQGTGLQMKSVVTATTVAHPPISAPIGGSIATSNSSPQHSLLGVGRGHPKLRIDAIRAVE